MSREEDVKKLNMMCREKTELFESLRGVKGKEEEFQQAHLDLVFYSRVASDMEHDGRVHVGNKLLKDERVTLLKEALSNARHVVADIERQLFADGVH